MEIQKKLFLFSSLYERDDLDLEKILKLIEQIHTLPVAQKPFRFPWISMKFREDVVENTDNIIPLANNSFGNTILLNKERNNEMDH